LVGGEEGLAWTAHLAVALGALVFTVSLWLKPVDDRLKAALAMAALLATPDLFLYDLPILSVPVAFLVSLGIDRGFIPGERIMITASMLGLLVLSRNPVAVPLLLALWLLIALRLRRDGETA
jgi:hypothetical protein